MVVVADFAKQELLVGRVVVVDGILEWVQQLKRHQIFLERLDMEMSGVVALMAAAMLWFLVVEEVPEVPEVVLLPEMVE